MYTIEIHNGITQIIRVFHRFGLWRNENNLSVSYKMGWKLLYFIFYLFLPISAIIGSVESGDRNVSIFLISLAIAQMIMAVKLVYILWKKEEILAFLQDIGRIYIADQETFLQVRYKLNKFMKFATCFILAIFVGVITSITFYLPMFSSENTLPLNIGFPLDWKNNVFVYWMAYVFVSAGLFIVFVAIIFNVIIWYLMMNSAIKYQILATRFRNIGAINATRNTEEEKHKLFLKELIDLIKAHRNIKETIERLKSFFANLFFAQITTSGICICGSVYFLAYGADLIQTIADAVIIFHHLFDIFMLMYLGNEIKLSSDGFSYYLFDTWMEQSESCKKCMIILAEVLKKPHQLIIGKLYALNLETFISIINLAYGMFNVLKNLS